MSKELSAIYEQVAVQINQVIENLATQNHNEIEGISSTINNLNILNDEIQKEYAELNRLSEWSRFTIAFYGETNSGKSTLIEALRLLLGEPVKQESQAQFKKLVEKNGLTQEAFDNVRQMIMDTDIAIQKVKQDLDQIIQKYAEPLLLAEIEIKRLTELLEKIRTNQNWWKRIITYFSSKEKAELIIAKQTLATIKIKREKEVYELQKNIDALKNKKQKAEAENQRLLDESKSLLQFADGLIIGDGRPDFTRENTSFYFSYNNQEFSLIDVPGIEGDEKIVSVPIQEAVRKAHAVFYVTRTPRPPQTHEGDEGNKQGTLEKMKAHLGAQTEVWTIYNHAVNNFRQLKEPLIGKDEQSGLKALDDKLKQELADRYYQSLVVSARPAYLGLMECVVPGTKDASDQRKLFERFKSKEKILKLSGLSNFVETLSSTIIGDYQNKIKRANFNKARNVLGKSIDELILLNQNFSQNRKAVRSEVLNAQMQIKVLLEQFLSSLTSESSRILRFFESNVRNKVYDEIEGDIGNDEFKSTLADILEQEAKKLEENLKSAIKNEADTFETEVTNVVKRSCTHLNKIINNYNYSLNLSKFDINIKLDNGVSVLGLLSSGVGIVTGVGLLAIIPVGWTVPFIGGVFALLGAVVSAVKSAWGYFDSSYKKSQQRKGTDKAIRDSKSKIDKEVKKILEKINQKMNEQIQAVLNEIEVPLKQYDSIIKVLQQAETELTSISNTIQ